MKAIILALFLLLLLPTAHSWRWDAHKSFVEQFYNNIDNQTKSNLNLELMKIGSIVPDEVFKDNIYHHYPPSLDLAQEWLDGAKEEYSLGHYKNASLAFGIASHYISDSFVAPHYNSETWELHMEFEAQVDYYTPKTRCEDSKKTLKEFLEEGSKAKDDWDYWSNGKSKSVPEKEVDKAMEAVYAFGLSTFNAKCINLPFFERNTKVIRIIGVLMILAIISGFLFWPKKKK